MVRIFGDSVHKSYGIGLEFLDITYYCQRANVSFQIIVEVFIKVVFWGIGI